MLKAQFVLGFDIFINFIENSSLVFSNNKVKDLKKETLQYNFETILHIPITVWR